MKIYRFLGFALVMVLIALAGCAKPFKEGSQTVASLQKVEQEARLGKEQVNATVAALGDMFKNQQGDLKKQFKTYSGSIDKLESQAKGVRKQADNMAAQKAEYLRQWETQMETVESQAVRQTAEQRRQEVEAMFANVQSELSAAGKVFDPFMSKLNDIRTAMNMDLNRNGLNSMRSIASRAQADAKVINNRLDGAISALSKAVTALSASGG